MIIFGYGGGGYICESITESSEIEFYIHDVRANRIHGNTSGNRKI